jgi:hypothetical protein
VLYATRRPITTGQGLSYASGVGWGFAAGELSSTLLFSNPRWLDEDSPAGVRRRDFTPLNRTLGVSGGAALGVVVALRRPDEWDVIETDVATYLGSAMALALVDVAAYRPPPEFSDDPGFEPIDWYQTEYVKWHRANARLRAGATLAGLGAGLLSGIAVNRHWDLDWADGAFAGLVAAEAAWVGNFWPAAFGIDDGDMKGTIRLPLHVSVAGALVLAELKAIPVGASVTGAYMMVAGNALGAGLPMLADRDDEEAIARVMVPVGIVATAAGVAGSGWVHPEVGDWTMIGIGVPIAAANARIIADYAYQEGRLSNTRSAGVVFTTSGAAATGLLVLGRFVEPDPADMLLLGSAGVWGGFFGSMVPFAARADWQAHQFALSGLVVGDVLVGATAVASLRDGGLEARDTVFMQMGGLTGATIGALGGAMFSEDSEDVALGSVIGASVGLGAGTLVGTVFSSSGAPRFRTPQFRGLRLPGTWAPVAAPTIIDGKAGVYVSLSATGW